MDKVFHFDSDAVPYTADAVVLCCFDERIRGAVQKFLRRRGILHPDMIIVAGGAKTLASPQNDFERDFILYEIRMSIKLHSTNRVLLMNHSDCATYGGLAAFQGDAQREMEHHEREIQRAAAVVRASFPAMAVDGFFVSFEGVFRSDANQGTAAAD